MSDRLHSHLTIGPRAGCEACAQVEDDFTARLAGYAGVSGTTDA